jgi:hypothetical protein
MVFLPDLFQSSQPDERGLRLPVCEVALLFVQFNDGDRNLFVGFQLHKSILVRIFNALNCN